MKTTLLMIASVLAAVAVSAAPAEPQTPATPPAATRVGVSNRLAGIAAQLNLSDSQKEQFKTAMQSQLQQARQIREDTSLTPEQRREKMQGIRRQLESQLKHVLTKEQFAKWQQIRAANRPNHSRKALQTD